MIEQPFQIAKLKVGITVFIGLIIFMIFIFLLGTNNYLFSKTYNIYLFTENSEGLIKGAPVTLGGYKVGEVQDIEFIPSTNRNVIRITLKILEKYKEQITISSVAQINSIGILGDKLINITVGNPGEPILTDKSSIKYEPSLTFENLTKKIEPGLDNLNKILKNISSITDSISGGKGSLGKLIKDDRITNQINSVLAEANSVIGEIKAGNGTLGKLIYEQHLYNELFNVSHNINELIEGINRGKGSLGQLVKNDSLYKSINSLAENLNEVSKSLKSDSTFVSGLMKDKEGYKQLISLLNELNKLVSDIKENPKKYINLSIF
ncbi:MAG: MlaD family protein [Melioribacteraceae bacterium]